MLDETTKTGKIAYNLLITDDAIQLLNLPRSPKHPGTKREVFCNVGIL